jgi:transposase InsO family protein
VPSRIWKDISVDFIEKLPISAGCSYLMVIIDRLGKGVILIPCEQVDTGTVISKFIDRFAREHGIADSIVSDRGTQFVNALWGGLCQRLGIQRRLSTAFHPQTDGQTERMNAVVEEYIRNFCNSYQTDWAPLTAIAQLAINGRDAASTGISPFFLSHGYNVEPLQLHEVTEASEMNKTAAERANDITTKLAQALAVAQAELIAAQQRMEDIANRRREAAPEYKVGQKVWLDLRNIRTDRPSKKLDARHAKYTVLEKIGSHAYRLDVPGTIHDVFHTSLLRPAGENPFPSQEHLDYQPPAQLVEGNEEYQVEEILDERTKRRGRGFVKQYLVRWTGYAQPTWEPAHLLEDAAALDHWLERRTAAAEGGE